MTTQRCALWIGFDPREADAYAVARYSAAFHARYRLPIHGLVLSSLRERGLYTRPTEKRRGTDHPVLWDVISEAPMATEFAISRFLVPHLEKRGWAMFTDCDVLFRADPMALMESLDPSKAVYCVKHNHTPKAGTKMDGQIQTTYPRKNWSSVMVFNCGHEANRALTVQMVNALPGRDLHRFCWLSDNDIGELPAEWNWLVGDQPQPDDPKIVHYTNGGPWFAGFEDVPFSNEWRARLDSWAIAA